MVSDENPYRMRHRILCGLMSRNIGLIFALPGLLLTFHEMILCFGREAMDWQDVLL